MTPNLTELKFPAQGDTKEVFFVDVDDFTDTEKSYQGSAPVTYYVYEVIQLEDGQRFELHVTESNHKKLQISKPSVADKCTLFKMETKNHHWMNAIQFPAVLSRSNPTTSARTTQPAAKSHSHQNSYHNDTESKIGASWAFNVCANSLSPHLATMMNEKATQKERDDSKKIVSDRIQLLLRLRDEEAKKYQDRLNAPEQEENTLELEFAGQDNPINPADLPF